jgi:hypothetical protein
LVLCHNRWLSPVSQYPRSTREIQGTGWVAFEINGAGGNLQPGTYTLTMTFDSRAVGRKTFTIDE